jgi:hypothetical protein
MASLALSSSDSRPDCSWHKVNSAEFMRLTKAKDQITQITEAILLDVLSVTLSLKASAKVMKAVWKSKLKTLVAPRPSRGKTCS